MPPDRLPPDSLAYAIAMASEAIAAVIAGRSLDAALAACWRGGAELTPAARGAVQDLAYGALRRYGRGDFMLARLLHRPIKQPRVRTVLLAALYRLAERPQDAHTTVDQAVAAAASACGERFKGLVNALLRNYLRLREALERAADMDDVARFQHPAWWIRALREAYPEHWQQLLAWGNARPPMTLRVNRRRNSVDLCLAALASAGIAARPLGGEAILLDKPRPVAELPGFAAGHLSVQDHGAQRAALLLAVENGMRVLDACAAPGGKSAHLLELAEIDLVSLDVSPERSASIEDNLQRLGLSATVIAADARAIATWWDGRPFDRVLVDAPCSASGVVRRHPDGKWLRREDDIPRFAATQAGILDAVWHVLAPDGKMLYCTCSLFPQENELQVAAFATRHADAVRVPMDPGQGGQKESLQLESLRLESLQLMPQAEHDGFYYALLQKRS